MLILNAGISHNSKKDWLMWVTIESERTKKGLSLEKRCWFNSNKNTIQSLGHIWSCRSLISFWFIWIESYDIGLKHSWRVQDSILPFWSPNLSIKREVWICPAAQTLFSVQSISRVLEVQMNSSFWHIKGGICHTFRHLSFQIKIIFMLSLFVIFKFYFMFYFY